MSLLIEASFHSRANKVVKQANIIKSGAEALVTIQEIKSLRGYKPRHVTKRDVFLFINSKCFDF